VGRSEIVGGAMLAALGAWEIVGVVFVAILAAGLTFTLVRLLDRLRRKDAESEAREIIHRAEGEAAARSLGARARFHPLDVRDESQWQAAIDAMLAWRGRLDVLVNNAGVFRFSSEPQDPEHTSLESWRAIHQINLDGVFLGCKHAIRAMRPRRAGSIINMSSRSGVIGVPRAVGYASSKAAIRNHTKSVALYCAEEGLNIRCNSIQPAAILTPMWEPVLGQGAEREKRLRAYAASTPLKRFGTIEEVAAVAVYLAADESAFTTGAELNIDGGMLAGETEAPGSVR